MLPYLQGKRKMYAHFFLYGDGVGGIDLQLSGLFFLLHMLEIKAL